MKKFIFILIAVISLSSCSVDDDMQNIEYDFAPITSNDLPDEFEFGETYEIKLGYNLPTSCHQFSHLNINTEGNNEDNQLEVYFSVVTSINLDRDCDEAAGEAQETSFEVLVDRRLGYKFYLLSGVNADNEPVFEEYVIPVFETAAQ